jgi:hypothetical protein
VALRGYLRTISAYRTARNPRRRTNNKFRSPGHAECKYFSESPVTRAAETQAFSADFDGTQNFCTIGLEEVRGDARH